MKTQWAFLAFATALFGTLALPCYGQIPKVSVDRVNRADLMKQARAKVDSKAWADAEGMYDQAIALAPADPEAWLMRGFVRAVQGNFEDALSDDNAFLVAAALPGGDTRSRAIGYANRADVWNRRQEPLRALVDAVAACAMDPTYARAWLARADAQYLLGNLAEANQCLEKARPLPGFAARPYTAEGAKQNATRHKPINDAADISATFAAAVTATESGEWRKAREGYGDIIATKPLSGDAWGNRGIIQYRQEADANAIADYSSAITAYELSGDTKNVARNLLNRAGALSRQSKLREEIGDLELALRLTPGDARTISLLDSTRKKLAATPTETLSLLARAKSLIEQARVVELHQGFLAKNAPYAEVLTLLDGATKAHPENAQFWYLRGVAEEIKSFFGGNQKAVPFYDKAITLDPQLAEAYLRRGNVLLNRLSVPSEELKKGWADHDQAITLGIRDANLFASRAERRNDFRDSDGAMADINNALAMEPKNPKYLALRDYIIKIKAK